VNAHLFVDESKSRGYLLAAAIVSPTELNTLRKLVHTKNAFLRFPTQSPGHGPKADIGDQEFNRYYRRS
jgi:hypothetical protein